MNIAICISGQLRAGNRAFPNIRNFIGDLDKDVDFFIHTWDINMYPIMRGEPWASPYPTYDIELDEIKEFLTLYEPCRFEIGRDRPFMQSLMRKKNPYKVPWFPLFYSWAESVRLMSDYSNRVGKKYDIVIKIRPDLIFSPTIKLSDCIDMYVKYLHRRIFLADNVWIEHMNNVITCNDFMFVATQQLMTDIALGWWNKYSNLDIKNPHTVMTVHNQFARYVRSRAHLLGFNSGNKLNFPGLLTILRPECRYDPVLDYNKCYEFDRIAYQDDVTEFNELRYITEEDLLADSRVVMEMRGFLPYIFDKAQKEL